MPHTTSSLPPKQTLYLSTNHSLRLDHPAPEQCPRPPRVELDGPSIVITAFGSAPRRFPLRRLRHILVHGDFVFPPDALRACLREGISITWHESSGQPLGSLWPFREIPASLDQRLALFWERSDWHWKYENWRRAQERRFIRDSFHLRALPPDLRPQQAHRHWRHLLQSLHPPVTLRWRLRFLQGLLFALVQRLFFELGVRPETLGCRTAVAALPDDFADLLSWALYPLLLQAAFPSTSKLQLAEIRFQCVQFFESQRPILETSAHRLVDRFDYFLGGIQ